MSEPKDKIREKELEIQKRDKEIQLAELRAHEKHMDHIYRLRWGGLGISAITIIVGAIMLFMGLEGSFDWAVSAPNTVGAKLTNASPGIVFAAVGLIIAFRSTYSRKTLLRARVRQTGFSPLPDRLQNLLNERRKRVAESMK